MTIPPGYGVHTGKDKAGGYIPICNDDSLVCITYPPGRYKGTTFNGASIEVTLLPAKTEPACVNPGKYEVSTLPGPEFRIDANSPNRVIGGVRFLRARTGAAVRERSLDESNNPRSSAFISGHSMFSSPLLSNRAPFFSATSTAGDKTRWAIGVESAQTTLACVEPPARRV